MTARAILRAGSLAMILFSVLAVPSQAEGQLYEEAPGRRELTGDMLVRPLQADHWMERGFNRDQALELHRQTTAWLVEFLRDRILRHHERIDRCRFRLRLSETENEMGALLLERGAFRYVCRLRFIEILLPGRLAHRDSHSDRISSSGAGHGDGRCKRRGDLLHNCTERLVEHDRLSPVRRDRQLPKVESCRVYISLMVCSRSAGPAPSLGPTYAVRVVMSHNG